MRVDRAVRLIGAPPELVYRALTNQHAVQTWLPPDGARGVIHAFEPRPGGPFRMTLVFETPGETGARKSTENTDIVEGEFLELKPQELLRQSFTFVSDDPDFAGVMEMIWLLTPVDGGTQVEVTAEHVPPGITPRDHQQGMGSSLANLAKFLES
jgi:uncharacterized protein YndB with AHSA1/START domain